MYSVCVCVCICLHSVCVVDRGSLVGVCSLLSRDKTQLIHQVQRWTILTVLTLNLRSPPLCLEAGDEKCAPPCLICSAGDQTLGLKDARSWFYAFYQLSQLPGLQWTLMMALVCGAWAMSEGITGVPECGVWGAMRTLQSACALIFHTVNIESAAWRVLNRGGTLEAVGSHFKSNEFQVFVFFLKSAKKLTAGLGTRDLKSF